MDNQPLSFRPACPRANWHRCLRTGSGAKSDRTGLILDSTCGSARRRTSPSASQSYHGTRLAWAVDLAWLPDTKANVALLNLQVPSGFIHTLVECNDKDTGPGCSWAL
jgi:hypothetical protein